MTYFLLAMFSIDLMFLTLLFILFHRVPLLSFKKFFILSCLPKSDLQDIYYPLSSWINIEGGNTKIENILRQLKYLKGRLKLIT